MIFRFDDISANTDFNKYRDMVMIIREKYPNCSIISAVNILCKDNEENSGQVYDNEAPFKNKERNFFYGVNKYLDNWQEKVIGKIASHGIVHCDHSRLSSDAQAMSILTSCEFLEATVFLPPFNRFNEDTIKICRDNMIKLIGYGEKWHSLEYNQFDDHFRLWYIHPWRWKIDEFERALNGHRIELGQL